MTKQHLAGIPAFKQTGKTESNRGYGKGTSTDPDPKAYQSPERGPETRVNPMPSYKFKKGN